MIRWAFAWVLLVLTAVGVVGCSKEPDAAAAPSVASEVRVAAAASLKPVLPDLIDAFKAKHPDITVTPTYGASGNFHSQLSNGAPFDVFLSADMQYPTKLHEAGLTHGPAREYAAGTLVIWALKTSGLNVKSLEVLKDERVKKVAIANPRHAPYGRAAEAALKGAGILETVQAKLVMGENVEQTSTFLLTGSAEAGLIPKSQALSKAMSDVGVASDVPESLYEPIRHGAVVMRGAKDSISAQAFLDFLIGPEAQGILTQAGLGTRVR